MVLVAKRQCSNCGAWRFIGKVMEIRAGRCKLHKVELGEDGALVGACTLEDFSCKDWFEAGGLLGEAASVEAEGGRLK